MPRQLRPDTDLARLILGSGKPAYVVAGEVGINYNRLLDYADGRMELSSLHRAKLADYFKREPFEISPHSTATTFIAAEFDGEIREVRATGDGVVLHIVVPPTSPRLDQAMEVSIASGADSTLSIVDCITGAVTAVRVLVEQVRMRPQIGVELRLRVNPADRRSVLSPAFQRGLKSFRLALTNM